MSDVVIVALIAAIASVVGSASMIVVGLWTNKKVNDIHMLLGTDLTKQIDASVRSAIASGLRDAAGALNGIAQFPPEES